MSLRRAPPSSRTVVSPNQAALEAKPWSRRAWQREQLRAHWPHLTLQQVELLKEVFQHLFDTEDKGYFTRDELFFVMEAMGRPTAQELDQVMVELDSNGDSVVDFPEFLTKFLTATDEQELLSVFHQLAIQEGDGDDDRVLTLTAVERSFQFVGEPLSDEDKRHLEEIFKRADRDGNGRLDIKEFTAHLEKMDDELFMGQAGLGGLLAAANASGGVPGVGSWQRSTRGARRGDGTVDGDVEGDGGDGGTGGTGGGGGAGGAGWAVLRALSGRNGGTDGEVESVHSNQGSMRPSLLSKLGIGRQRRASVNSANIVALTEKLASLGYAANGVAMRVASVNSPGGFVRAQSLLHQHSDSMHSHLKNPRLPLPGARAAGVSGGGDTSTEVQLSAFSARLPRMSQFGPAQQAELSGDASSVSIMRLVSSMGQLGTVLGAEGAAQGPGVSPTRGAGAAGTRANVGAAPVFRGHLLTAPVRLSRTGSFADGPHASGSASGPEAAAGAGIWPGGGAVSAAAAGLTTGASPDTLPPRMGSSGPVLGGAANSPAASSRNLTRTPSPSGHLPQTHYASQSFLPYQQHTPSPSHLNPRHPHHAGYTSPRSQPLSSGTMSQLSTPTGAPGMAGGGLSPSGLPYLHPGRDRDRDRDREPTDDEMSSFPSPLSPASPAGALGTFGLPSPAGGMAPLDRAAVNMSYAARVSAGLRPPVTSWRQANVIQEAPEEGDLGYGMGSAGGSSSTGFTAPATTPVSLAAPPPMMMCMSSRIPEHRTSAPTRFSRLRSFPDPVPLAVQSNSGVVPHHNSPAVARHVVGGSSGGAAPTGPADGVAGGLGTVRPLRTGSGGEGRRGPRFGGLMAAMFSRQRSLGMAAGMSTPSPLRPRGQEPASAAWPGSGSGSVGPYPDGVGRPTPSQAHLMVSSYPSSPKSRLEAAAGSGTEEAMSGAEGAEPPAKTASVGSWSFAAGAWAAVGWLRRASSVGSGGSASSATAAAAATTVANGSGSGPGGIMAHPSGRRLGRSGSPGGALPPAASRSGSATAAPTPNAALTPVISGAGSRSIGSRASLRIEVPGGDPASVSNPSSPTPSAGRGGATNSPARAAPGSPARGPGATLGDRSGGGGDGVVSSPSSPSRFRVSPSGSQLAALLPFHRGPRAQRAHSASGTPGWPGQPPILQAPEPAVAAGLATVPGPMAAPGWWLSARGRSVGSIANAGHGDGMGPLQPHGPRLSGAPGPRLGPSGLRRSGSMGGGSSRLSVSSSPRGSFPVLPTQIHRQTSLHQHPPHRLSHQGSPQVYHQHMYHGGPSPFHQPYASQPYTSHHVSQPLGQRPWEPTSSPQLGPSDAEQDQTLALTEVGSPGNSGSWAGSGSWGGGRASENGPPGASGQGPGPSGQRMLDRPVGPAWTPGRSAFGHGASSQVLSPGGLNPSNATSAAEDEPSRRVFQRWHSHSQSHSSQLSGVRDYGVAGPAPRQHYVPHQLPPTLQERPSQEQALSERGSRQSGGAGDISANTLPRRPGSPGPDPAGHNAQQPPRQPSHQQPYQHQPYQVPGGGQGGVAGGPSGSGAGYGRYPGPSRWTNAESEISTACAGDSDSEIRVSPVRGHNSLGALPPPAVPAVSGVSLRPSLESTSGTGPLSSSGSRPVVWQGVAAAAAAASTTLQVRSPWRLLGASRMGTSSEAAAGSKAGSVSGVDGS